MQYHGKRVKLAAVDGNHIDAMFVDQRGNQSSRNGQKLVCCVWYIHTYICTYVCIYMLYLCEWVGGWTREREIAFVLLVLLCQWHVSLTVTFLCR